MTTLRNSVQLIGRLGMDPEVKTFENDKIKVRFSLATSDFSVRLLYVLDGMEVT